MALVLKDRVQETTTTSGTGTLTLAGAVIGFQTFSSSVGNGNTTYYTIYDTTAYDWEVGIGTVGAGTLSRDTVLSNSLGTTALINFAGNTSLVWCDYPSEKAINYDVNGVATIGETLGYSDTGIVGSFASTVAGYNQVIIQNKSTATNASSNLNVSNDSSTASTGFAELGINSSTFVGSGSLNIAGAAYLASAGTDLTIGTYNAYNIHFVTNSNTTDAMTIYNSGGVSLGGYGDPGIGTLYANNIYLGYTIITAAAGTTILTNASSAWQQVVGTTTQNIQMPDATTLFEGFAFTIANNSTGAVTIKDAASATLDTAVTGGTAVMVLLDNSTVAGTWQAYSYLPSSYDFSTTTANFGGATITNALWNGTTIATGYGGTGLTGFTAANNALYSTSSSALTAGTLPIAAGGTGATTFTTNGVVYGNGTSALGVTAAGTTGQVLVGNTGSAPSWSNLSSVGVTTFQTSLSGLTPSSATSGAITLAGTLDISSGGTGQTTASAAFNALSPITSTGDLIIGNGTNSATRLAIGASTYVLTSNGTTASWAAIPASGVTSISFGSTGLTPNTATTGAVTVAGTLAVGSGGTGQTTYTDGQLLIGNTTGNTLAKSTLTAGTGISITNGSGSITIASTVTGATISNDTSTASYEYPLFAASTSGSLSTAYTSNAKLLYKPSTGDFQSTTLTANGCFFLNPQTLPASYTVAASYSASTVGPLTIPSGMSVTVSSGARWVVL